MFKKLFGNGVHATTSNKPAAAPITAPEAATPTPADQRGAPPIEQPPPSEAGSSQTSAPASGAVDTPDTAPPGSPPPPTRPALSREEAQRQAAIAMRQSLAFAQIVSLLARSPTHRVLTLGDLDWLVIPPLTNGQFAIAEAKTQETGVQFPIGLVLWASVSPDVDKRLSDGLTSPIRLSAEEWKSGDQLWLVDAIGDDRVVTGVLGQLAGNAFGGRKIKARVRDKDGVLSVRALEFVAAPASTPVDA